MKTKPVWTEDDARKLSARLFPLANQIPEICEELEQAGLGTMARLYRQQLRDFATDDTAYAQVFEYWIEYAKERLAGLMGPMDILERHLPPICAYRSALIDRLRADAKAGKLKNEGAHVSPQIEPTIKRRLECSFDDPRWTAHKAALDAEQRRAAERQHYETVPGFGRMTDAERYNVLLDRYRAQLEGSGFSLDSTRRGGVVFRRFTSDGKLAFIVADTSKDQVGIGSLSVSFGLTLPRKAVHPLALPLSCVATIPPECLVPEFHVSRGFSVDSSAEMFLAAGSFCLLARTVSSRIDRLLSAPDVKTA